MSEYIQQFEKLRNQLLLYNSALDENFFIDEFIEGLKAEYRAAIRLHLPADMDTACLLAMLQEEELEATAKSPIKDNYKSSHRFDRTHTRMSNQLLELTRLKSMILANGKKSLIL